MCCSLPAQMGTFRTTQAAQPFIWQSHNAKGLSLMRCSTPAQMETFRTKKAAQPFMLLPLHFAAQMFQEM